MSETRLALRNDPVTFEVLRHRLWQINDEQGQTIIRVSGSPVATEGNDFNVALANAAGEPIAIGPYIVMHIAAITHVIRNTIALHGEDGIRPGDMYLVNDPWMGAGHQNDYCVIQPVFWQERRIAWTASVIHQVDVGGPTPGSWNFAARSTFEEAPRYKAVRLVRDFVVQPEIVATILTNSRLPDQVDLDTRAQIAAANVARERLLELIGRYGVAVVENAIADILDHSQALFRAKLLSLPDGEWRADDFIDHDGHEERIYAVRCRLEKRQDRLLFDFAGTSGQAAGFINCTLAGAAAGAYAALFACLCRTMPWNAGILRQVDLSVSPGSVHNCDFPTPVGSGVVHASWATMNCTALALGKMLAVSEASGEAMAGWAGSTFVYNIFGIDDAGARFATMLLSSDLQGCGARAFADGFDVGGKLNAPRAKVTDIEPVEANFPLLYLYRRRARDSGGAGRWRGGVSAESAMTVHGAQRIDFSVNTVGTDHSSTQGLCGGFPGGGATVILATATDLARHWAAGRLPQSLDELEGTVELLPSKKRFALAPGDVFVAVPHGGGGHGDPLLRDPERVAADVAEGLVSPEWAARVYGVMLDDGQLATRDGALRQEIRRARLIGTHPSAAASACSNCGGRDAAARIAEIGEAGPWIARRLGGHSPRIKLWQLFCAHCGSALEVEERLAEHMTTSERNRNG